MAKFMNLAGEQYNHLTVLNDHKIEKGVTYWKVRCVCGTEKYTRAGNLRSGSIKSCGCKRLEAIGDASRKHGMYGTKIHNIWLCFRRRCLDKNNIGYDNYGGRGISFCDEWNDFEVFYSWAMKNGYKDGLQIDRIDNDGNYEPSNCRFVTPKENCRNRRNNRMLTYRGETKCIAEWSEITGISYARISQRIDNNNWSVEDALTKPVKHCKRRK